MEELKLPIGIENFEEIRTEGFYYVDKTGLIKELLNNWGKDEAEKSVVWLYQIWK